MDTFSMPVELRIETEGEPEFHVVEVVGNSSDYALETFGKPREVKLDPITGSCAMTNRLACGWPSAAASSSSSWATTKTRCWSISRRWISTASVPWRTTAPVKCSCCRTTINPAANEFREALNGDRDPEWVEVWSHINLGKIFDITGQRERAVNEYQLAVRTRDNTQNAQDEASKYLASPYRRPRAKERTY